MTPQICSLGGFGATGNGTNFETAAADTRGWKMTNQFKTQISRMAAELTNDELGAAVRLLCRIVETGHRIAPTRIHRIAMMSAQEWGDMSSDVLRFFDVTEDGRVGHDLLAHASAPPAAEAPRTRAGRTSEMSLVVPTAQTRVPGFPDAAPSRTVSIKKAAFDTIVDLFRRSGQSESTARAVMASLMKNWPQGDVFAAVDAAARATDSDFLVDPRSWIVAWLKNNSTPLTSTRRSTHVAAPAPAPRARKPARIATPDFMGLTDQAATTIQERNRALRLKIEETD